MASKDQEYRERQIELAAKAEAKAFEEYGESIRRIERQLQVLERALKDLRSRGHRLPKPTLPEHQKLHRRGEDLSRVLRKGVVNA